MPAPKSIEIPTTAASTKTAAAAATERTIAAVTKEEPLDPGVTGVIARQPAFGSSFSPEKCPTRQPVLIGLHRRRRDGIVRLKHCADLIGTEISDGKVTSSKDAETFSGGDCDSVGDHHHRNHREIHGTVKEDKEESSKLF
jgi:hypothetical protein